MNKRKKATFEVKRAKVLKNLSLIVETEKLDEIQKKAIICDLEIYKQKNNGLFDQNEELKQENKIFFGLIMYLLKNEDDQFVHEMFSNEQDVFVKRIIDCIMKSKNLKQKKSKKNHDTPEDIEFFNQNSEQIHKVILEIENSLNSKFRETIEEKDDLLYSLQKKILDLEFQVKENKENIPTTPVNTDSENSNIDIKKIHEIIESRERNKIKELNLEIEKLKSNLTENEKLITEKNDLEEKFLNNEKVTKSLESQLENLIKENDIFTKDTAKKMKEIEERKKYQFKESQNQIENLKEMNTLLKDEIAELETKLKLVGQTDTDKDKDIIELKREILTLQNSRDVVELEKKEVFAEKERLKIEKNKSQDLENKFNAEIMNLKSELQNRINAAIFHKKNFIKIDNEAKYLNSKIKNMQKEEIPIRSDLQEAQKKVLLLKNENKLLYDDISNYKAVFQEIIGTSSPELIESIEKYRKLLRCPTCDRNYKDTVIDKCMHVLCRECADSRLKTRSRKCPICGESFCATDVKRIFL